MYTVFIKLAQEYLLYKIKSTRDSSITKDRLLKQSGVNYVLGMFGVARDIDLSASKQDELDRLRGQLESLNTELIAQATAEQKWTDKSGEDLIGDSLYMEYIKSLIRNTLATTSAEATRKSKAVATTEKKLESLVKDLHKMYDLLHSLDQVLNHFLASNKFDSILKKLNIEKDVMPSAHITLLNYDWTEQPIGIYLSAVARYIATKGLFDSKLFKRERSIPEDPSLDEKKIFLCLMGLRKCLTIINGLNHENDDYHVLVNGLVGSAIAECLNVNAELCGDEAYSIPIPVTVSLITVSMEVPGFQPSEGDLKVNMMHAQERISRLHDKKKQDVPMSMKAI